MRIHAGLSTRFIKPALLELGGKNAAVIMESADLDAAAEGVMRSAFSLQNQKCSATSRVYVHRAVTTPFIDALLRQILRMHPRRKEQMQPQVGGDDHGTRPLATEIGGGQPVARH